MSFDRATVREADVEGKRVLLRADLNVPLADGAVADDTRIRAALPTLGYLLSEGASVVLVSHLGRPKGPEERYSMEPVAQHLANLIDSPVRLAPGVAGPLVLEAAEALEPGQVLLLENSRFEPGEKANDPDLSKALAELADIYVNDAFGAAHRAHATTAGVTEYLPAYGGFLLEDEVNELTSVRDDPERPLVVVFGGAKISDKIGVLERFLEIADTVLIGGAMCFSFFKAQGIPTGDSLIDEDGVALAGKILERAGKDGVAEVLLPVDLVIAREFSADSERKKVSGTEVPDGWMGLDIGPSTVRRYAKRIREAGTVLWNGPMGAFEMKPFEAGTRGVAEAVAHAPGKTVIGGGDSAAAIQSFGLADHVDWLSTGGGASLELLEGRELPGVTALMPSGADDGAGADAGEE